MSNPLVQELIEAGIHFGQRASNWNPRMSPYIYGKRSGIHIIDIKETVKGLLLAKKFLSKTVASGKDVCFVGTKRQAKGVIEQHARDAKMHWVTERWLGGTLTNFSTIRSRLKRLEELESIEQNDNFQSYSKKMESQLRREMRKIKRNLDGIREMKRLPGALVIIDVNRETTAIKEARKLGIPVVCLIDTDANPELADIAIPGNDDSMRSIDVVIRELCKSIAEGKSQRTGGADEAAQESAAGAGESDDRPRRSRRAQFRADDATPSSGGDETEQAGKPAAAGSPAGEG
jgi:small subunit ribosomal protein S2